VAERPDDESVLRDWLSVLARQKWIVLLVAAVVPLLALATSQRQQRLYQASSTVLVSAQNPTAQALNLGAADATPPDRYVATQARLARVGTVAAMALRAAHLRDHSAAGLLERSSVSADLTSDLLTFSVTDPNRRAAVTLANAYAKEFTVYRRRLDSAGLSAAIDDARRKLAALAASGQGGSDLSRRLSSTAGDLEQLQTLGAIGSSATQVGSAGGASLVQPRTKRNVILGVIFGLALGIAMAFIREALDTRVRSAEELRERLGMPLLGQVPKPTRAAGQLRQPGTLSEPGSSSADAFRIVKNRLELSKLDHDVGSLLITSPRADEDKSATAAYLALTLARSGRHVILVDLDLRTPSIHRLLGLDNDLGFTGVAMGFEPARALNLVDVDAGRLAGDAGTLEVLTSGELPPDPGEFLSSRFAEEALAALYVRCDLLVINTPPVLTTGDAMAIAKHADAVIVVAELNRVRREALIETRRLLDGCTAMQLGVIATAGDAGTRIAQWTRLAELGARYAGAAARKLQLRTARVASVASARARRASRARLAIRGPRIPGRARLAASTEREDGAQQVPHV
jgi:tyrosine-protein kinase